MAGMGFISRIFGSERRRKPRDDMPRNLRVLVADDSATIRAVLGKMLAQNGYEVLKAPDGETAIALAIEKQPDLVFLDIVMPGMNGFAVLRALRHDARTESIPIVMISGNLQATEQFYVQRFGADDFMKKPFGRDEVFARIAELAASGRLAARERPPEDAVEPMALSEAEDATIPDIAMPDPQDLIARAEGDVAPVSDVAEPVDAADVAGDAQVDVDTAADVGIEEVAAADADVAADERTDPAGAAPV